MYIVSDAIIQQQEDKGRAIYTGIFTGVTWTPMVHKFAKADLSGNTSNTGNAIIKQSNVDIYNEVKVRNLKSTSYRTTFLETKKYEHLMDLANLTTTGKAFYFVAYSDATAFLFDLKAIKNIEEYWTTSTPTIGILFRSK